MEMAAPAGTALPLFGYDELLVVLPVEEARNVDRVAAEARFLVVDLRLGRAASNVRHALEQGSSGRGGRLIGFVLILRRSDRRSADRARQDVVGPEHQLIILVSS